MRFPQQLHVWICYFSHRLIVCLFLGLPESPHCVLELRLVRRGGVGGIGLRVGSLEAVVEAVIEDGVAVLEPVGVVAPEVDFLIFMEE